MLRLSSSGILGAHVSRCRRDEWGYGSGRLTHRWLFERRTISFYNFASLWIINNDNSLSVIGGKSYWNGAALDYYNSTSGFGAAGVDTGIPLIYLGGRGGGRGGAPPALPAPSKPKPTKPCLNVFNFGGFEADAGPVSVFSGTVTDMNPGDVGSLYELSLGEGVNFGVAITRSFVTGKWDYFLFGGAKVGGPAAGAQTGFIAKPGNILSPPDMFGAYVEGHARVFAAGFGADIQHCHT